MEHTKHLWRALLLLLCAGVAGIVVRHFLVPESFGLEGPYRYDALADHMAKAPVHGSLTACKSCHGEVFDAHALGKHATVRCEVCHGPLNNPDPLATHVKGEEKNAAMPTDRSVKLCINCHQRLDAKPDDMPQIDAMEHLTTLEVAPEDGKLEDGLCITCHDVHSPSL